MHVCEHIYTHALCAYTYVCLCMYTQRDLKAYCLALTEQELLPFITMEMSPEDIIQIK